MAKIKRITETGTGLRHYDEIEWTVTRGSVSVNPPSISTVSRGSIAVTVTGAKVGDIFIPEFNASIDDDLIFLGAKVTADDQATFYFYNPTAGTIDDAAQTWSYTLIERVA